MTKTIAALFFLLLANATAALQTNDLLRSVGEINALPPLRSVTGLSFDLCGTVDYLIPISEKNFIFRDAAGSIEIANPTETNLLPGDLVRVEGGIEFDLKGKCWPKALRLTVKGHGPVTPPVDATISEVMQGRCDYKLVRVSGTVLDEFQDDIDRNFHFLLLAKGMDTLPIVCKESDLADAARYRNAEVTVSGACLPNMGDWRIFHGHGIPARASDIVITSPAPQDPFDVPEMESLRYVDSSRILGLTRRRVDGKVLAVWHGDKFLLQTGDGRLTIATTVRNVRLPSCGRYVRVVGLPDTDLFNINFVNAIWKDCDAKPANPPAEEYTTLADMLNDNRTKHRFPPSCHGKLLSLSGLVRSVPRSDFNTARLYIEHDETLIPIDVSSCPESVTDISLGCRIALTGVCILETESWKQNAPIPKVTGFTVILRSPADVRILERPSWWTPARLLSVVGFLLAGLLGILAWNIALQRLAERRGRELAASAITKAESDLKVYERTRLAVELHDSIAQNLTGVSLAIRAQNYEMATKTLDSCREDLRNCMWDLRNLTLEDGDINAAIRKTLAPHVGDARLSVRFSIPRERLSDNTAHAILRILRELATNAVRHGKATALSIAGCIEGDNLTFSVRDNGCGFDPDAVPGMEQGHFGLQGIRDRVDNFEGDLRIDSEPGKGTKVTIALHVPHFSEEHST